MKNFIRITVLTPLAALLTACTVSGPVDNKQAPGTPGEKTFMVEVKGQWIEVSERDWDHCEMQEPYPACRTSSDR